MEYLLAHPAIQGGVAPFVVAFMIALVFVRVNLLAGLGVAAGFAVMVLLTTGFSFSPMTSTRKIILLVLLMPILAFAFQLAKEYSAPLLKVACLIAGISVLWVLWPVVMRGPVIDVFLPVLSYVIYAAWMMAMFMRMTELPGITASTSATACGIAIGGSALIGASALLGQMGIALSAVGAGFLLVQLLFRRESSAGLSFTMTSGLLVALLLPAAIVYAKVPWLVLPVVALIPLICIYPFSDEACVWKNTAYLFVTISFPVGLIFYLTWQSAGLILY